MKNLNALVTVMTLTYSLVSIAGNDQMRVKTRKLQQKVHAQNRLLTCVREIVQFNIEGDEGIYKADQYLSKLTDNKNSNKETSLLADECEKFEEANQSYHDSITDLDGPSFDVLKNKQVLELLMQRDFQCKAFGVHMRAGAGVMIGAGLTIGNCLSDNGQKFYIMVPRASAMLGGGWMAGVAIDSFEVTDEDVEDIIQEVQLTTTFTVAYGMAYNADYASGGYQRKTINEDSRPDAGGGVGAGVAAGVGYGAKFPVRLSSIYNDYSDIKRLLKLN